MTSWTKQKGHPLVTVTVLNATTIRVSQQRYILHMSAKPFIVKQ